MEEEESVEAALQGTSEKAEFIFSRKREAGGSLGDIDLEWHLASLGRGIREEAANHLDIADLEDIAVQGRAVVDRVSLAFFAQNNLAPAVQDSLEHLEEDNLEHLKEDNS